MSQHHVLRASPRPLPLGVFRRGAAAGLDRRLGRHGDARLRLGRPRHPAAPIRPSRSSPTTARSIEALTPRLGAHILTGPIAVEGAEPGDVLQIDILSIEPRQNWGYTRIRPLVGTLPEDFPITKIWHSGIDRQRGIATLPIGIEIELAPFFGVMGVAPPPVYGACSSIQPREFGGNMDLKELVAGTTLYLPVWAPGALFSVGDGHGVQGDGEVCITALETALTGTFRLTVRKDLHLKLPRAETPTHHITMAFNEDLDDAAKDALRADDRPDRRAHGPGATTPTCSASLAVDMRVTQLVDGNKGIHAMLPKRFADVP